ncbi:hypothetical protein RINTHH_9090 [Richelia intracellularis HH01]|uniref:Uncharacterized protein n=1 Tax=Richelia intracellularis HH01 TaxID=1165094 RepID=M1WRR8_9NOST|nr:hypothetical protein [Richelia intracellularis]CCH67064.1 hypothetical protein RINTHH_9090 [Richelia intracellularis HH01]
MPATHYHSPAIDCHSYPDILKVNTWVNDGMVMVISHHYYPHIEDDQFYRARILTSLRK